MAVLQQHAAPWLMPGWRIYDVFLRLGTGVSPRPHFEASFARPIIANGSSTIRKPFKPIFSRNVLLYDTGIALIELAMDGCMEDSMNEEEKAHSLGPHIARAEAAARLVDELEDYHMPPEYCNATRGCLKGDFGTRLKGKELGDDDLFSEVYRKAAKPLMEWVANEEL
jgi:hypothetical protein